MIDTVMLAIEKDNFNVHSSVNFDGERTSKGKWYQQRNIYSTSFVKKKNKTGLYFPTITISSGRKKTLKIQVSLPKLMFGTNLFELDETYLGKIIARLLECLNEFGITTTAEAIQKAVITRLDFSKIIRLPTYLGEADAVIRKLTAFDYKPSSDFDIKNYNNGMNGVSLKFINSTQGYAIYDKLGEILSNGFTTQELGIAEKYKQGEIKRTALKFELSLHRKDSLEAILRRKIQKGKGFHLVDVLNYKLAKSLLNDIFDTVFNSFSVGLTSLGEMEENQLWAYLDKPELAMNKQEKLFYWVRMANKFGIKGTLERLKAKGKGGSIPRYKKDILDTIDKLGKIPADTPNLVGYLREKHREFKLIVPSK